MDPEGIQKTLQTGRRERGALGHPPASEPPGPQGRGPEASAGRANLTFCARFPLLL